MQKFDVLIVDALGTGSGGRRFSRNSIGSGPRAIAGVLERLDYSVKIMTGEFALSHSRKIFEANSLAISAMSMDIAAVVKIIKKWRARNKSPVLIGGPITSDPSHILSKEKASLLVLGEGERTVFELAKHGWFAGTSIDLYNQKGIAFFDGKIIETESQEPLSQDEYDRFIPSTERIVDYPYYKASKIYVNVLRGCSNFYRTTLPLANGKKCIDCKLCFSGPLNLRIKCPIDIPPGCGFCSVPNVWGAPRSRSKWSILKEIEQLVELGVSRILLEAPDFLDWQRGSEVPMTDPCNPKANIDAIEDLLESINSIINSKKKKIDVTVENIKACLFDENVVKIISKYLPNSSLNIGCETGDTKHYLSIGKPGSPQVVLSAVKIAARYGLSPFVYFIHGLPGQTKKTVSKTEKFMWDIYNAGAARIILYGFRSLPRSAFYGLPEEFPISSDSMVLVRAAEKINALIKQRYLGKIIEVVAAEPLKNPRGYTICYPIGPEPAVSVKGKFEVGTFLKVKIIRVISDRLLEGRVI